MSAQIIHSKFTQDLVSFSLNGFSKSKVNNNTQQDEKIKQQLTPFDRSEPQLYCHCTLIDISKTLSKCIHTFSETDVFCSSIATLSILRRVSRPIEAVTIELSIALHRLPSPCLHWRTLSYTRVRSVLYWSRAVSFRVMHAYLNLLNSVHLVQAQPTPSSSSPSSRPCPSPQVLPSLHSFFRPFIPIPPMCTLINLTTPPPPTSQSMDPSYTYFYILHAVCKIKAVQHAVIFSEKA